MLTAFAADWMLTDAADAAVDADAATTADSQIDTRAC